MPLKFYKYHGAGNDFIIFDNRRNILPKNFITHQKQIEQLCNRNIGIGADGLMILQNHDYLDFEMLYFNSDGFPGSMCGNGGRCIVAMAHHLNVVQKETGFFAPDGKHFASVISKEHDGCLISLGMNTPKNIKLFHPSESLFSNHVGVNPENNLDSGSKDLKKNALQPHPEVFLDTGSPHHIVFVSNLNHIDVVQEGRKIRNSKRYKPKGTNVNFVECKNDILHIRTYERGVENETLACGTGITAAAIASHLVGRKPLKNHYLVNAKGGSLEVNFDHDGKLGYFNVVLIGPAQKVFEGSIKLN